MMKFGKMINVDFDIKTTENAEIFEFSSRYEIFLGFFCDQQIGENG